MGNGQDELTMRYIFFHRGGEQFTHSHCAVVSTAFSSIAALAPSFAELPPPLSRAKMGLKRAKTTEGAAAAADAGMKKVDGD